MNQNSYTTITIKRELAVVLERLAKKLNTNKSQAIEYAVKKVENEDPSLKTFGDFFESKLSKYNSAHNKRLNKNWSISELDVSEAYE